MLLSGDKILPLPDSFPDEGLDSIRLGVDTFALGELFCWGGLADAFTEGLLCPLDACVISGDCFLTGELL